MAIYRAKPDAGVDTTLFTASSAQSYCILYICNPSDTKDFANVSLLKSGEEVGDKEIYSSLPIPEHDTFITSPILLEQTESVSVKSAGGNLIFTLIASNINMA